jgi:hypothetical protein
VTKDVSYFDFFEARPENSQAVLELKELFAQNILGNRIEKRCGTVELYIPFIDTLDRHRIDFPLVETEVSWFEKGFKFFSEKVGHFILYFSDVQTIDLLRPNDSPWAILNLKENLFFSKLTQPVICLRFTKESQMKIFVNLKEKLVEQAVLPVSDILEYPAFMQSSLSLQNKGIIKKKEIPHNFIENPEIVKDQDFVKFNTNLEKLRILNLDDQAVISDADVVKLIDNQAAKNGAILDLSQQEAINLFLITGPPFCGKRAFAENVWNLRSKFPTDSEGAFYMVSYDEVELNGLTCDKFYEKIMAIASEDGEEGTLNLGDWVLVVVPHTICLLTLMRKFYSDKKFVVRACCTKINSNDLFTKNSTPLPNLRRFLEEGFIGHCFIDYEGVESTVYSKRVNCLEKAFPHVKFHEISQNKVLWGRLEQVFVLLTVDHVRNQIKRQYNAASYAFTDEVIRLDYRIPILEDQLKRFKEVIIDLEGALLYPEPEPEPEPEELIRERRMNIKLRAQDELLENIRKLMQVTRGLRAKRDQSTSIPFISRMKGVFRFEGQLHKGPYSLYLSPYGFYFENLGIATQVEEIEKQGMVLFKSQYEDFEFSNFGFYIYGQNLDPKAITLWLNKNLLPVGIIKPES